MRKLRKKEVLGIKILEELCGLLDIQPGDIIEHEKINQKRSDSALTLNEI